MLMSLVMLGSENRIGGVYCHVTQKLSLSLLIAAVWKLEAP